MKHLFDNDNKQRNDIDLLRADLDSLPKVWAHIETMNSRVDRLELLCETLMEVIVVKGLANEAELSVLMQQIDLEDGVEDGARHDQVRGSAPRCRQCDKFINPARSNCVYCDALIEGPAIKRRPPPKLVGCGGCGQSVAESSTFFTAQGLRCEVCFAAMQ